MDIHFETHGLTLHIYIIPRPDFNRQVVFEDNLQCDVRMVVPSFTGAFSAHLQLIDFGGFLHELQEMYAAVGEPKKATLSGIEPGIHVVLTSTPLGTISGAYEFNDTVNGTELMGSFSTDQSYLPSLISQIKAVINQLSVDV